MPVDEGKCSFVNGLLMFVAELCEMLEQASGLGYFDVGNSYVFIEWIISEVLFEILFDIVFSEHDDGPIFLSAQMIVYIWFLTCECRALICKLMINGLEYLMNLLLCNECLLKSGEGFLHFLTCFWCNPVWFPYVELWGQIC